MDRKTKKQPAPRNVRALRSVRVAHSPVKTVQLGKTYEVPGKVSADDARLLIRHGWAEPCSAEGDPVKPTDKAKLYESIREATDTLRRAGNEEDFLTDGETPSDAALERVLGYPVTAAERNAALKA